MSCSGNAPVTASGQNELPGALHCRCYLPLILALLHQSISVYMRLRWHYWDYWVKMHMWVYLISAKGLLTTLLVWLFAYHMFPVSLVVPWLCNCMNKNIRSGFLFADRYRKVMCILLKQCVGIKIVEMFLTLMQKMLTRINCILFLWSASLIGKLSLVIFQLSWKITWNKLSFFACCIILTCFPNLAKKWLRDLCSGANHLQNWTDGKLIFLWQNYLMKMIICNRYCTM